MKELEMSEREKAKVAKFGQQLPIETLKQMVDSYTVAKAGDLQHLAKGDRAALFTALDELGELREQVAKLKAEVKP
jgi:hypothetical protein